MGTEWKYGLNRRRKIGHTTETSYRPGPRFAPDEEADIRKAAKICEVTPAMFVRLAANQEARKVIRKAGE